MSVSFGGKFLPTKLELIKIRRSLAVARNVHRILEDKRDVLINKLNEMIERAEQARVRLYQPLREAFISLSKAYMSLGISTVDSIAAMVPETIEADIHLKTILGIRIPSLEAKLAEPQLIYGFKDTDVNLDDASKRFRDLISSICEAAEIENTIFRLAEELKKTQRLLNALEHIVIPRYEEAIKFISMTIEEREREEFVKLKHVKNVLELRKFMEEERAELKV
ncbi:MAG: V-type ATP synthase subunit D [Candidatus Caldarchaeales archaeon]